RPGRQPHRDAAGRDPSGALPSVGAICAVEISMDAPDFPAAAALGPVDVIVDTLVREMAEGGEGMIPGLAPSRVNDARFIASMARMSRFSVRPGTIGHFFRQSLLTDLRDVLPTIA